MKISSLILWPVTDDFDPKVIDFFVDGVTVVRGAAKTGKSSIWALIDYCLGSTEITFPTSVHFKAVSWFGVVFEFGEERILFARSNRLWGSRKSKIVRIDGGCIPHNASELDSMSQRNLKGTG